MKALILFLMLIPLTLQAAPSRRNCSYYLDVEKEYSCGFNGYPLKFGYRLCNKYLSAESQMPQRVKTWFPKIRLCLQKYLEDQRGAIRDCSDLHRKAINSHIGCYVQTGFCDLGVMDQAAILRVTSTDVLNPDVLGLSFKVKAACLSRK